MKKIFLITLLFCAGIVSAFAQEEKNEASASSELLPVKGDFGISVDATPFFKFIGNMFNGTINQGAPTFGNDFGIRGIYFLEDNRDIRASLHLNIGNKIFKQTVQDDYAVKVLQSNEGQSVIDVQKNSFTNVALGVGYGFHRGYGRLQASYGPQVGIFFESGKTSYTYANAIDAANQTPTTGFGGIGTNGRTLKIKDGNEFGFSVGAFVGVEFFVAPRLSIGGNVSLDLNLSNRWQGETTKESWDAGQNQVVEKSTRSLNGHTGGINFGTTPKGDISVNFYF